jgi:hypothetical protein
MIFPRARLVVSAALFVAWLGYLALLVSMSRHTIVLSRPQFLVADLCVAAELTGDRVPSDKTTVNAVFWSAFAGADNLVGKTIHVRNLPDTATQGYETPGLYILALERRGGDDFAVVHVPPSPSFVPAFVDVDAVAAGPDLDHTARLTSEILGMDFDDVVKLLKLARPESPVPLKQNVPMERANRLAARLQEDERGGKQKDVARISITNADIRIYPFNAETKNQIEEMQKAR